MKVPQLDITSGGKIVIEVLHERISGRQSGVILLSPGYKEIFPEVVFQMNGPISIAGNKPELEKRRIVEAIPVVEVLLELRNLFTLIFQPDAEIQKWAEKGFVRRLLTLFFEQLRELCTAGCRQPALVGFDLFKVIPILVVRIR